MRFWCCIALLVPLVCACHSARGDGFYVPKIDPSSHAADISEPTQKAFITRIDGREKMILQVSYRGDVSGFAWLVPTPARPKVSVYDMPIFHVLHETTAPRVKYWLDADAGLHAMEAVFAIHEAKIAESGKVDVLERKRIGIYDVAVLRAPEAANLLAWLKLNGYRIDPKIKPVLTDYIRHGWVFTASRIILSDQHKAASQAREGTLPALLFDFPTEQLVYPLKISSLNPGRTEIMLYVLADHRLDAKPLETVCVLKGWRPLRKMDDGEFDQLFSEDQWQLKSKWLQKATLTKLVGRLRPEQMNRDLVLARSATDDLLDPPGVPPPFFENLGAAVLMIVLLPFVFPFGIVTGGVCLAIGGRKGRCSRLWFVTAILGLTGMIWVTFAITPFDEIGYWPVGVAAPIAVCVALAIWLVRRLRPALT